MKNLKKVLAVVLAFAMIIGTNAFAASFSDLDKTASYAEAVSVLADLGILKGYDDGTVKPEGNITRAEFAAIVCRIKGLEDAANSAKGQTIFSDVPADSWASGYINMASQQGIINGVGGGLFLPEENVKFEEAVKMVVAALGYGPQAESMGYPVGYLTVASQTNITKGVSGATGAIANRGTVARLAYNSLDVPLMEQVSYGTGSVQYQPGDKILLDSLGLTKVEATILEIPGSTGSSNALQPDQVRLRVNKHYIAYDGKLMISDPAASTTYSDLTWVEDKVSVGTTDAQSYLNRPVIAYLEGAYDDDVVIKAIVEKTSRIDEVEFASEDIYSRYTDMTKATPEVSFYDDAESSSSYTRASLDPNEFSLYVNDISFKNGADSIKKILGDNLMGSDAMDTFTKLINKALDEDLGFDVTLLNNDTDSEYDVAYIDFYTDMVVDMVNANTYRVTSKNNAGALYLDPTERNASFTIENADGTEAKFEDIKTGSVLSVRKGIVEDSKMITGKVVVMDNNITGKITEISDSDKEITVEGKSYKVETGNNSGINFAGLRTNTEATFYLNARGNIFYMDKSAIVNNMKVGFATKIGEGSGISTTKQIQMMNEEGEFVVYEFANRVTINEADSSVTSDSLDPTDYNVLDITGVSAADANTGLSSKAIAAEVNAAGQATGNFVVNAPVAYDLNSDGKIYKLNLEPRKSKTLREDGYAYTAFEISNSSYSVNTDAVAGVYMTDKTLLFSIDGNAVLTEGLDENDITIMKKDALVDSQTIAKAYAINCDDDSQAKMIVGQDLVNALVANSNLMVITGVSSTTNANGDNVQRLTGLMNGEEVNVLVGDDTDKYSLAADGTVARSANFAKGDVVVYQSGAGDELKAIAKIFSVASKFDGNNNIIAPATFAAIDITNDIVDNVDASGNVTTAKLLAQAPNKDEVEFYFGYARDLRNSSVKLVKDDSVNTAVETAPDYNDYIDVTFRSANIVMFDKFEGRDPRIAVSDLGDLDYDREVGGDVAGDYVFVRVINDIAKDAVIIKTK